MITRILLAVSVLSSLLAGCADDDYLRVSGSADVELDDGTTSGFSFDDDTRLDDDRASEVSGAVAGHCTITSDTLDVGLERSEEEGLGLRSLTIRIGDDSSTVTAFLGGEEYMGAPPEECTVEELYRDADEGVAAVELDCALYDAAGTRVESTAELHFAGCE